MGTANELAVQRLSHRKVEGQSQRAPASRCHPRSRPCTVFHSTSLPSDIVHVRLVRADATSIISARARHVPFFCCAACCGAPTDNSSTTLHGIFMEISRRSDDHERLASPSPMSGYSRFHGGRAQQVNENLYGAR